MGNKYEVGLNPGNDTVVRLVINGTPLDMSYDTAFKLAVSLRGYSKIAKQNAGDISIKAAGFANLTDAVAEELKIQRRRDGTAAFTSK